MITGFILHMDVCLDWQQEVLEPVINAVESIEAPSSNVTGGGDSGHFCEPTTKKQFVRH